MPGGYLSTCPTLHLRPRHRRGPNQVAESFAEFWANRIGASKIENRSRNPISIPTSHSADLRPLREPPGRAFRTRTEQIDPFPADRMASLNPFYRLAFSRIKMESPSGRPQIESTRLLETRLVAMGRILHSP